MVLLSPNRAVRSLAEIESRLGRELNAWRKAATPGLVSLTMPKLKVRLKVFSCDKYYILGKIYHKKFKFLYYRFMLL